MGIPAEPIGSIPGPTALTDRSTSGETTSVRTGARVRVSAPASETRGVAS
jgi:hypothetical protein